MWKSELYSCPSEKLEKNCLNNKQIAILNAALMWLTDLGPDPSSSLCRSLKMYWEGWKLLLRVLPLWNWRRTRFFNGLWLCENDNFLHGFYQTKNNSMFSPVRRVCCKDKNENKWLTQSRPDLLGKKGNTLSAAIVVKK